MGLLSLEHPKAQPGSRFLLLFFGEARDRTYEHWFTRRVTYPLHHGGWLDIDARHIYKC